MMMDTKTFNKIVKKWGKSLVIVFNKEDLQVLNDLKEGDLIFFKAEGRRNISHVGIYLANNKFAHASTSQGVTISDLADPYWQRRLFSLGRVAAQN
jgi:lipoprotein Spr